jgi:hypothetical protein
MYGDICSRRINVRAAGHATRPPMKRAPLRLVPPTALVAFLLCLPFAGACDEHGPSAPTAPLGSEFTLAPSETATIDGTPVRITFVGVSGDSRCPGDATCIQGGDALVRIRAQDGSASEYELHTGDSSRAAASHGGLRIELTALQPYPFSSRPPIQPGDYRATLKVSR